MTDSGIQPQLRRSRSSQGAAIARWCTRSRVLPDGLHLLMGALSCQIVHLVQRHLGLFAAFLRVGHTNRFAGCRSGAVELDSSHPHFLGSTSRSNNTGKLEGVGHLLAWALALDVRHQGKFPLVADRTDSSNAIQALQRCNKNVASVHTTRRA